MKRKLCLAATLAIICALNITGLTACASEASADVNVEASEEMKPMGDTGVMAQVTAVNGSTLTVIEAEGGRGGRGGGRPDGEAPEMTDGEAPELPEGEMPDITEGEAPEKPEGEAPEMTEGGAPEKPEGEAPELPDGEAPEKPEGEAPEMTEGKMPEMKFEGEEKTITVSDSIIFTDDENGEKTQASLSDITEGTIIMIQYDEDGAAPSEIIIRK